MRKRLSLFLMLTMLFYNVVAQNYTTQTIQHNEVSRSYGIYVPEGYNQNSPTPLVFNFHGFGGTISYYMNEADMRLVSDSNNFILVYPQGSLMDGATHWNPCPIGGDNKSNADDLGFAQAIIQDILESYNIDTNRVYAVGYSNGGMMAYGLATNRGKLLAAVASVSGAMLDCIDTVLHPMPVLHMHGTSDGVIAYGEDGWYPSVQSTLDYWINFNNTTTEPEEYSDNSNGLLIQHYVYNQGNNGVSVEHYKYNNGGHDWFNETYQGQTTEEIIWEFFSRYDINGLIENETSTNNQYENIKLGYRTYPNPVNNKLVIELGAPKEVKYKIYSMMGKLLKQGQLNSKINTIDLNTFDTNVYLIEIDGKISKFMKVK